MFLNLGRKQKPVLLYSDAVLLIQMHASRRKVWGQTLPYGLDGKANKHTLLQSILKQFLHQDLGVSDKVI